jgi:ribosomal protein L19E
MNDINESVPTKAHRFGNLEEIMNAAQLHRLPKQKTIRSLPGDATSTKVRCKCAHAKRYHEDETGHCDYCGCKEFRMRPAK